MSARVIWQAVYVPLFSRTPTCFRMCDDEAESSPVAMVSSSSSRAPGMVILGTGGLGEASVRLGISGRGIAARISLRRRSI